jgi:hypothetical protein
MHALSGDLPPAGLRTKGASDDQLGSPKIPGCSPMTRYLQRGTLSVSRPLPVSKWLVGSINAAFAPFYHYLFCEPDLPVLKCAFVLFDWSYPNGGHHAVRKPNISRNSPRYDCESVNALYCGRPTKFHFPQANDSCSGSKCLRARLEICSGWLSHCS